MRQVEFHGRAGQVILCKDEIQATCQIPGYGKSQLFERKARHPQLLDESTVDTRFAAQPEHADCSRSADQSQSEPLGRGSPDQTQVGASVEKHAHGVPIDRTLCQKSIVDKINGYFGDVLDLTARVRRGIRHHGECSGQTPHERPHTRLHRRATVRSDLHLRNRLQILASYNRHLLVVAGDIHLRFVVPTGTVGECQCEIEVASVAGAAFGENLDRVLYETRGFDDGAQRRWSTAARDGGCCGRDRWGSGDGGVRGNWCLRLGGLLRGGRAGVGRGCSRRRGRRR
jgi:hypothetical protein